MTKADNDNLGILFRHPRLQSRLGNEIRDHKPGGKEEQTDERDKASDEALRAKFAFIGNKRRDGIAASQVDQRIGRERAGKRNGGVG